MEKKLSCREISAFYTEYEQFMEFLSNLCSKSMLRKICAENLCGGKMTNMRSVIIVKAKKMIDYLGQGFLDPCPSLSPHLQYFILNVLDVYMRCVHLQSSPSPRQESCSTSRSHSASCGWRPGAPPHSSNLGKKDLMANRGSHRQRNFSIFCTTSREHMCQLHY